MDENNDIIKKFEEILRNKRSVKPLSLYSGTKKYYSNDKQAKTSQLPTQHDLLLTVSKQLKAIQNADCVINYKSKEMINTVKRSKFLPLTVFEKEIMSHQSAQTKNTNRFETQCVSDTQLVNLIQNAEIMDVQSGVTQEFDHTFCYDDNSNHKTDEIGVNEKKRYNHNNDDNSDADFNNIEMLSVNYSIKMEDNLELNKNIFECEVLNTNLIEIKSNDNLKRSSTEKDSIDVATKDECDNYSEDMFPMIDISLKELQNECSDFKNDTVEFGDAKMDVDEICIEELPSSPIFNVKSAKKSQTPLVFDLDKFEAFEQVASQIIEMVDFETAKCLINSQILGKELFLPSIKDKKTDIEFYYENVAPPSPILETRDKTKEIKEFKEKIVKTAEKNVQFNVRDEILFSSDEEEELLRKNSEEIPFTCKINLTGFRKDDFDDTMYVGFQTASNKSIKICTESFSKAKNLFENDIRNIDTQEPLIADLVEKFDGNFKNIDIKEEISDAFIPTQISLGNENDPYLVNFKTNNGKIRNPSTSSDKTVYSDDILLTNIPANKVIELSIKQKNKNKMEATHLFDTLEIIKDKVTDIITQGLNDSADEINSKTVADNDMLKIFESTEIDLNLQDNTTVNNFIGFKTASNKNIDISESALAKSKELFKDINMKTDKNTPKCVSGLNSGSVNIGTINTEKDCAIVSLGFKTASNKDINISTKTLNETKDFYKDIDEIDSITQKNILNFSEEICAEVNNKITEFTKNKLVQITRPEMHKSKLFPGFKTANNKEIKISEEALFKSKKLLQNCEDDALIDDKNKQFKGFKTASNKNIVITETALAKSKNLFHDIQDDSNISENAVNKLKTKTYFAKNLKENNPKSSFDKNNTNKFERFQTASNKPINISAKALEQSKKIFQHITDENVTNIDDSNKNNTENAIDKNCVEDLLENSNIIEEFEMEVFENETISAKEIRNTGNHKAELSDGNLFKRQQLICDSNELYTAKQELAKFQGFKTGNNKEIIISKEALARTKRILEGIDYDNTNEPIMKQEYDKFTGFKTASDKNIVISEDALARSKNIFEEIDNNVGSITKQETAFVGFKTASKKEITFSKEPLARSMKIFEEIDNHEEIPSKPETSKFVGFRTANKKEVTISKEALARSKKLFEGIDTIIDDSPIQQETAKFVGFKTASKKEVTISKEALARSKKIFEGIDNIHEDSSSKQETAKFVGFKTASKKEVTISKNALVRSRKIFEGLDCLNEDYNARNQEPAKVMGFQTASNKKVYVSEEALKQSKKLLEAEAYNKFTNNTTDDTNFCECKTANNKTVAISEQALAKTRNIFDGIVNFESSLTKRTTEFAGFQTASNKKVIVSEDALRKSKMLFDNIYQNDNDTNFDVKTPNFNKNVELDEEILQSQVLSIKSVNTKESKSKNLENLNNISKNNSLLKSDNVEANLDSFMDTQVLNNFEKTLYSEDFFKDTSGKSKRSGSPILSCPKPKRRKKFKIPYSQKTKTITDCVDNIENSTSKIPLSVYDSNLPKFEFDSKYKKNKKYTLKDLEKIERDQTNTELDSYMTKFKYEELSNYEFEKERNDITAAKLTTKDLKQIFEKSVNKKLVPENWIENHMQLIIWKLISYEMRFPKTMVNTCTTKNVLNQLKYRYDRELFNMERPPLRKIFEKDDIPNKCMVLCVVLVYENDISVSSISSPTSNVEILLTDGWYTIKTTIDKMLTKLIYDGKIKIGSKIMVQGAELLNCDQGIAPWEDTSQIRLKISGNSTAPVPWSTRLGWSPSSLLSRVRSVSSCGGRVSRLRLFVSTVYPPLTVEKIDCSTVTRSERLENLHQMKHEADRQVLMEKIYEEVEKEMGFQDQDSQESDCSEPSSKRLCLETGSQIARVMRSAKDPGEFQSHLTLTQKDLLQEHTKRKRDKLIQKVQERVKQKIEEAGLNVNRNVVSLVKARVVDVEEKGGKTEVHKALLSIWKPNDSVMEIVKEGSWIEIMNVVPTAVRYSELQISAGRQSMFKKSKYTESDEVKAVTSKLKRTCYQLKDLIKYPAMTTENNEIDTVGFIFLIEPENKNFDSTKGQFQNVFLADSDKNMICVNFWGGLKKYGYDNFLDTGQIVACINLQKRVGNSRKSILQYRATEFSYFTKTPKSDFARKIIEDLSLKFSTIDRRKFCEDCANLKSNYSIVKFQGTEISPYRCQEVNMSKNKMFIDSPLTRKSSEDFNLTGLDFESTFKQTDTQELSPRTLLRKKKVNEKIAKLKFYGEYYGEPPPALSPIQIINISKNAGNSFKSPLLPKPEANVASKEKIVLKEQNSVENLEENIQLSPVLNRTYVKKNINPVKLKFSNATENNIENCIDHFAEDFDGSPPLSLD